MEDPRRLGSTDCISQLAKQPSPSPCQSRVFAKPKNNKPNKMDKIGNDCPDKATKISDNSGQSLR